MIQQILTPILRIKNVGVMSPFHAIRFGRNKIERGYSAKCGRWGVWTPSITRAGYASNEIYGILLITEPGLQLLCQDSEVHAL